MLSGEPNRTQYHPCRAFKDNCYVDGPWLHIIRAHGRDTEINRQNWIAPRTKYSCWNYAYMKSYGISSVRTRDWWLTTYSILSMYTLFFKAIFIVLCMWHAFEYTCLILLYTRFYLYIRVLNVQKWHYFVQQYNEIDVGCGIIKLET